MRGDLAVVRLAGKRKSWPDIFTGGGNSSSTRVVADKWADSPSEGDRYCTGGAVAGEICDWDVAWGEAGIYTYTGPEPDEVARRVWVGKKGGAYIQGGDSGGPVYTVKPDGKVLAKGIISGASGFGGEDHFAGTLDRPCENVFTDIHDASLAMPGDLSR